MDPSPASTIRIITPHSLRVGMVAADWPFNATSGLAGLLPLGCNVNTSQGLVLEGFERAMIAFHFFIFFFSLSQVL